MSDTTPISPAFVQLGYVTNDFDRASAVFKESMGVPELFIWKDVHVHMELYGAPATAVIDLGYAWRSGTMVELILPRSGAIDFYMPGIEGPEFGLKLHHVGFGVDGTPADFDERWQSEVANGRPLVNLCRAAMGSYCLVDGRKDCGHYVEYLWNNAQGLDFFAKIPRT